MGHNHHIRHSQCFSVYVEWGIISQLPDTSKILWRYFIPQVQYAEIILDSVEDTGGYQKGWISATFLTNLPDHFLLIKTAKVSRFLTLTLLCRSSHYFVFVKGFWNFLVYFVIVSDLFHNFIMAALDKFIAY